MPTPPVSFLNPPTDKLADDDDQLDWDVERDGRMRDHATDPGDEPITLPLEDAR